MKIAISTPKIQEYNLAENFKTVLQHIDEATTSKVNLLLFPEAALTGLVISDDYETDKQYAISLESDYIDQISAKARAGNIWLALGFIEISDGVLYDSAVLIDNTGSIALHQRRLSTGWCCPNASPKEYGYGDKYNTADTPWGKVGFMLCGDLFNVPQYAKDAKLNILLFPYARCFNSSVTWPQQEWDTVEWPEYANQVRFIGATTAGANYIAPAEGSPFKGGFGGGFIADANGELLASQHLNTEGLLMYDF